MHVAGLRPRPVTVYLPAAYESESNRRFPVLYAHDGQFAIGRDLSVDAALDALADEGTIEPRILVAIDRSQDRSRELKPAATGNTHRPSLQRYGALLVDAVKPQVDHCFRTRTDRESTALIGYSLGGLANLFLVMWYPDVFGSAGSMSPSLWWRDRTVLRSLDRYSGRLPTRLWLDAGTREGRPWESVPYFIEDIRDARDILRSKGMSFGENLGYLEAFGEGHSGDAGGRRMHDVLAFLFGPRPVSGAPIVTTLRPFHSELSTVRRRTAWSVDLDYVGFYRLTAPVDWCRVESGDRSVVSVERSGLLRARGSGRTTLASECFGIRSTAPIAVLSRRETIPDHRRLAGRAHSHRRLLSRPVGHRREPVGLARHRPRRAYR